ncbi:hypothetical protein [Lysobacter humi (ex Lee et al. 2017)]
MESAYWLGAFGVAFSLLIQIVMLALQASALSRHGHRAFTLLVASSIVGLLYCLGSIPMALMQLEPDVYLVFSTVNVALMVIASLLGVAGTALLFRSYTRLTKSPGAGKVADT